MISLHLLACVALTVAMTALPAHAFAQVQSPPQSPALQAAPSAPDVSQPAPPAPETAPQSNPGLIEELGNLWKRSTGILPSASETFDSLNSTTRDAASSIGRLARPSAVAKGRVACLIAPNGAPDCKAAAEKLCQTNGYTSGASIESDAAESCPAQVRMSGRPAEPGECRVTNYVIRALCQ